MRKTSKRFAEYYILNNKMGNQLLNHFIAGYQAGNHISNWKLATKSGNELELNRINIQLVGYFSTGWQIGIRVLIKIC